MNQPWNVLVSGFMYELPYLGAVWLGLNLAFTKALLWILSQNRNAINKPNKTTP
jgi:hypothetical protein